MQLETMTGMELMQAYASGTLAVAPMSETIPMHSFKVDFGRVKFKARGEQRHTNPFGTVHGGVACTVLDSATGIAVHSTLDAGGWLATVDLNVKFFRPMPKDEDVLVEAWVVNTSKTLVYSEGKIEDSNGKLLAHGAAIYSIKPGAARGAPNSST